MTKVFYTDVTKSNIDYYNFVSFGKKDKIKNYKNEHQRKLSAFCELLLYNYLGEKIDVLYEESGKPYIKDNKLYISFSHSGNISVCAVSDKKIGVDVEKIKNVNIKIAEKYFSNKETKKILKSENIPFIFIKYWTLKESYLKYLGTGLKKRLDSFEIQINDVITVHDGENSNKVKFNVNILDNYILSTCSEETECEIQYVVLDNLTL